MLVSRNAGRVVCGGKSVGWWRAVEYSCAKSIGSRFVGLRVEQLSRRPNAEIRQWVRGRVGSGQ